MRKILLLTFCISVGSLHAHLSNEWNYSKAAALAQEGNWQEAQTRLNSLLVEEPDRADLLYDAGVTSYRLKQYEQADAYFESAAQKSGSASELKKQSLFNSGNSKVAQNKLQEAMAHYDAALELDPNDQRIIENREKVKQMLELQKQQQEQKDQQKNKDQKKDNDQQNGQQNDQQQSQQDSDQQENNKEQSQDQQGAHSANGDDKKENDASSSREQEQQQRTDQQQNGQNKQRTNDKANHNQSDNKQNDLGNSHDSPSKETKHKQQLKDDSHPTQMEKKEQEMQAGQESVADYRQEQLKELEDQLAPNEKWMARALHQLEQAEEQEQRKLIKASVQKQAGEHDYTQNCW